MKKVTAGSTYSHPQMMCAIPAGLAVTAADNLPDDSEIKYWLAELTPEMEANEQIASWHRNYGFGLREDEVKTHSEIDERANFIVEILFDGIREEAISHEAAIQKALIAERVKVGSQESINDAKHRAKVEWLKEYLKKHLTK